MIFVVLNPEKINFNFNLFFLIFDRVIGKIKGGRFWDTVYLRQPLFLPSCYPLLVADESLPL